MKKIYPILIKNLEKIIYENFFLENKYADKVLQSHFKSNKKLGSRDRNFISESFYEIIRWKRHFEFFINESLSKENISKIILAYLITKNYDFESLLCDKKEYDFIKKRIGLEFPSDSIKYSLPDWLVEILKEEVENWEKEITEMNNRSFTVLRVSKKIDILDLKNKFLEQNIDVEILEGHSKTLVLKTRKKIDNIDLFKQGLFEIQDTNSQKIIDYLDIKKGQLVIDACAGAGGKTLQIAENLENTGVVYAFDIYESKLLELERRVKRNNLNNIKSYLIKDFSDVNFLVCKADRVLVDVPCSGLGVLKRNPDTKWKLKPNYIENIKIQQRQILENYSKLVNIGGKILYSTCSILSSENEKQVEFFLKKNNKFRLISERNFRPSETKFDGFYLALMERIS